MDWITGDLGSNTLTGGQGADVFVLKTTPWAPIYITDFQVGTDKIDLSALGSNASHLLIQASGTSNSVYLEATPGTFNANTDLAMVVNTTITGGLHASDFVF